MSFICSEIILCHVCTCTCTEGRRLDHVLDTQAQADFEVWFVHVFFLMALYFGCPHVVSGMSGDALKKDITIIVRHTRTLFIFLQYSFVYTFWFRLQTPLMCARNQAATRFWRLEAHTVNIMLDLARRTISKIAKTSFLLQNHDKCALLT